MRLVPVACALLLVGLAGCSGDASDDSRVLVIDQPVDTANSTASLPEVPSDGAVAGIVLDASYTPIEGARVRVPGLERVARSDDQGRFGISNLPEGALFLRVEHEDYHPGGIETVVERGGITEVTVTLQADFKEPFVSLQPFAGFADLSMDPFFGFNSLTCDACQFQVNFPERPEAIVVEAGSDRTSTDPTGMTDDRMFFWTIYEADGDFHESGYSPDPMRLNWTGDDGLLGQGTFRLSIYPQDLVPQMNIAFDVVVASFHNGADPDAWTLVGGSA